MPLHYKAVTSIWDADIVLVNDLAVVDTWTLDDHSKLLPKTVMLGMALGCRFAVERYLKAGKDHCQHGEPLSVKFKPAVAKAAGVFLTEAFTEETKTQ